MKRKRRSPQRELILDILKNETDHLSVDQIFDAARHRMPKISLGTVYRNLAALTEAQAVMSMVGPQGITLYELYKEPHHHFICEQCDQIQNLDSVGVEVCVKCIQNKEASKITKIYTMIYGSCKDCQSAVKAVHNH